MRRFTRRRFLSAASTTPGALSIATRLGFAAGRDSTPAESWSNLVLWYDKPASRWADALPIGNGRLGVMVYGGSEDGDARSELLQLNEDTLWSGKPRDGNNP